MNINKIIKKIYSIIPENMKYKIKICRNKQEMFRILKEKYPNSTINDNTYKIYIESNDYQENRSTFYNKFLYNKKGKKKGYKILALADNPILLNRYDLNGQSEEYIAATILHEIGHLYLNTKNETIADNFAIEWMEKY